MSHAIDPAECTTCSACQEECAQGAVSLHESGLYFVIDPAACIDCGDCALACPTAAVRAPAAAESGERAS